MTWTNKDKWIKKQKGLWKNNAECPNCGNKIINHNICSIETGYDYCSDKCALEHVNKIYKNGMKNHDK